MSPAKTAGTVKTAKKKAAKKSPSSRKTKPALSKKTAPKKPASKKMSAKKPVPKKTPARDKARTVPKTVSDIPLGAISVVEVEIIKRDADRAFGGKKIAKVEVLNPKVLAARTRQAEFKSTLTNLEVFSIFREGRAIFMEFAKGAGSMAVLLGEGGQLLRHSPKDPKAPETALIISFKQGGQLRLNSHLGDVKVHLYSAAKQPQAIRDLRGLGMDLIEAPVPWSAFLRKLRSYSQNRTIKDLLLDSSFVVGLGDIYSDEILYKCGLKYNTPLKNIPDKKVIMLLQAAVGIFHEVEKHRGTTLADGYFRDLSGKPGEFQDYLNVYGRDGELTPFSMYEIEKRRFKNRWTYFCPKVQV